MSCPIGSYIQVYDAFFGRLSLDVCPVDEEEVTQTQRIDCVTTGNYNVYKCCDTMACDY